MTALRRQMAFGAAWMMSTKFVDRLIGLVSTIVLARVLLPTDFGIVAMAMSVVALLELFSAFGLDSALIHRRTADREHFDTAWTFNVLFGATICLALCLVAWPAAKFYQQPSLLWVLLALSLAPAVQGFENVGLVAFRKELNFRADFLVMIGKRMILFVLTVALALYLRSYWALVIGIVGGRALGVLLSFVVHPYRPRFSLAARAELFGFSTWMLGTNMLTFALQRVADVIVGRGFGPRALGLYTIGLEIARLPASELVAPINRALFPGLAKIAHDREALRAEYYTFIGFTSLLGLPAALGVASVAHLMVPLVLGPQWLDAVDIVTIIAASGALQILQTTNYAVYLAVGRPSRQVVAASVQLAFLVPSMIYLSATRGVSGAALAFALSWVVTFPVTLTMVLRELGGTLSEYVRPIWRPAVSAAAMCAAIYFLRGPSPAPTETARLFVELILSVIVGAALYAGVLLACWVAVGRPPSAEATVLSYLAKAVRRFRPSAQGLQP